MFYICYYIPVISQMNSFKLQAIELRKKGESLGDINKKTGIKKSTLSFWFKDLKLSKQQKEALIQRRNLALKKARILAVQWHNTEKNKRLKKAEEEAIEVLKNINVLNPHILDLALAMLYMGEGFKKNDETGMGNSDPLVLKTFITVLIKNYGIKPKDFVCELYLRADQKKDKEIEFWKKELNLERVNFKRFYFDKRTKGFPTIGDYHGVCAVRCGRVAIKRKIVNLSRLFCKKLIERA